MASAGGSGHNLLLVTIDTLRADRLASYGAATAATPTLDRLAEGGVLFRHAVAVAPLTLPAHASLLTGLEPPAHGLRHNAIFRLGPEPTTLAEVLVASGYRTAAFVGSFVLDSRYGLDRGFAVYDDRLQHSAPTASSWHFNERPAADVTDAALSWLAAADSAAPFFAWVHYYDPHRPFAPPSPYAARFADRPYEGEIAYVDSEVARLLGRIADLGQLDRTLVAVISDHGEALGEHGEQDHGLLLYEGTARIPFILSSPSLLPRARVVDDRVVSQVDLMPTVLELLGIEPPPGIDGQDALRSDPQARRAAYMESLAPYFDHGWSPLYGLRGVDDKLIWGPDPELYDLRSDPSESLNLYGRSDGPVGLEADLRRRLAAQEPPEAAVDRGVAPDAEERARLGALGYLASAKPPAANRRDPKVMLPLWNRVQAAAALLRAGRAEKALAAVEAVLAQDPDNGRAWYVAGAARRRLGQLDNAETALLRAVRLTPRASGYVTLAQVRISLSDASGADQALDKALALDSRQGLALILKGDLSARNRAYHQALAYFEWALQADPRRVGALAEEKIRKVKERLER